MSYNLVNPKMAAHEEIIVTTTAIRDYRNHGVASRT